jgi:hypothetical protein
VLSGKIIRVQGRDGEMGGPEFLVLESPSAKFEEDEHVEEVHGSKDQDDGAHFQTEGLDQLPGIGDIIRDGKGIYGIADVDKIEADQQQVIDSACQFRVAMKDIDEEYLAIAEECAGDPNSEDEGKGEIKAVGEDNVRHSCMV